ncbi:TonB-dependent receptor [Maribellus sp. CM-23]|uniref:TonB-dependent receptor n=1 Tax=Maribellus sp. CM-23 TaxID=2781026 RepID=UPI001F44B857|nr:TonB-dependent receptor [Maribellus sp. CM-23]MCE4566715.1 TonB-dependent receptor [Maribellus sp. CM-23]
MKLTWILLLAGMLQVSASVYSQSVKFSFNLKNQKVIDVLNEIETNSEFRFFYQNEQIELNRRVTVQTQNATVEEILTDIFKGTDISYSLKEEKLVLLMKGNSLNSNGTDSQQGKKISGKVTDKSGHPLPGVTVVIKGSTQGTVTDADGKYSLNTPQKDATLVFSFVGMRQQEIPIGSQVNIDVRMEEETIGIEEVVTIAYSSMKKTSLTSSVSSFKGEELTKVPITDLSAGLGGRVSGLITRQNSGAPGDDKAKIFVRGISTTGNAAPLLIVDGVPRDFSTLDPNSIESITVLKDGAAVAPYGIGGANGVVLVTTKKGKKGKPTITYDGYYGIQNYTALPEYVNSYEYALLKNAANQNVGLPPLYNDEALLAFQDGSDPDRYSPMTEKPIDYIISPNAPITNHSLSISGGNDQLNYFANIGYQDQKGMWSTASSKKYNFTSNVDAEITNTTSVSLNLTGSLKKRLEPSTDNEAFYKFRIFELIGYMWPDIPTIFSNGMVGHYAYRSTFDSGQVSEEDNLVFSTFSIKQDLPFIKGLSLKASIAYDASFWTNKRFQIPIKIASLISQPGEPNVIKESPFGITKPKLIESYGKASQLTYQIGADYSRSFNEHNFSALVLLESRENESSRIRTSVQNYSLYIDEIDMGSSNKSDWGIGGRSNHAKQMGLVYRLTYDYKSKYLIETSGRYDGSYYFAPERRWGFFPSVALGWRISEEGFIKDNVEWIDNLKVRGSYGEVGALAGAPFQYISMYGIGGGYNFDDQGVVGLRETSPANENITWERAKKTDVGFELSILNSLFRIEADFFHEKRSNMLVSPNITVPSEYGIGLNQINAGVMQNQGFDLTLGTYKKVNNDLSVSISGNLTFAKNKLIEIFETDQTYNNPNRRRTGRPLGAIFGLEAIGYFQESDFDSEGNLKPGIPTQPWGKVHPGDIRYADLSGPDGVPDGKIDESDDQTYMGYMAQNPQLVYGLSPSITYKNFSLDIFVQGAGKADYYGYGLYSWAFHNGMSAHKEHMDYWTPNNPNAKYPRITPSPTTNNTINSSKWVYDVSYVRLKNIHVSYTLPAKFLQKIKISKGEIYLSGQNLLTFTKNKNFDPEVLDKNFIGHFGFASPNQGWQYPLQKVVSLGLKITI